MSGLLQKPNSQEKSFQQARKDLRLIFIASFLIHLIGMILMMGYVSLALGSNLLLESLNISLPLIGVGFVLSFISFAYLHRNVSRYFLLGQSRPLLKLQREALNFPKISVLGFLVWTIVGFFLSLWFIKAQLAPLQAIIVHVGLASFFSGSLVAILQFNLTESILQRHLFPHLLSGYRLSQISKIIKVPTYMRIMLMLVTTAILPCMFIFLLYTLDESSGTLLLYILAFTVFNALWQGGFLLRNISQPIGLIAGKLKRFREGELEEGSQPIWRTDGIGQFSEMFDDLVASIKERDFIRSTFNRYLDPSLVDNILNGEQALGGSEKDVSVMFADIRGFTTISEQLHPVEVVELLNHYFEEMVQEIIATDGIPDKFLGDGLLAVWGLSNADQNHAQKCCTAALAMLDSLQVINQSRLDKNQAIIEIGIGIHAGSVIAGNIGSQKKMEYTVIGDTVNTSSRLEGLCKQFKKPLLISGEVYQQLSPALQAKFEFLVSKALRGKQHETPIYGLKVAC